MASAAALPNFTCTIHRKILCPGSAHFPRLSCTYSFTPTAVVTEGVMSWCRSHLRDRENFQALLHDAFPSLPHALGSEPSW